MNLTLKDGRSISGDIVSAHDLVLTVIARIDMALSDVDLCWLRQALEASKLTGNNGSKTQCAILDAVIAHCNNQLAESFPNSCVGPYPDTDNGECGAAGFCPMHSRTH